jgi:hypothetical protein
MALLQKAYLGATPLFRNTPFFEDNQLVPVNTAGPVTVTANSSAHTKGAWAEVIASTSANASYLVLVVRDISDNATDTATLIDLATGASGSESAFASNIAVGGASNAVRDGIAIPIPFQIPSGARLSARIQSVVTGGKTASVFAYLFDAGDYAVAPTTLDVIGTFTATSKGTEFSGSSGTYVEAIASTTQAYRAVTFVPSVHNAAIFGNPEYACTIGVGAAGSEAEMGLSNVATTTGETVTSLYPWTALFARNIPAASRLAVKHTLASNPDRYGFCLIGIP